MAKPRFKRTKPPIFEITERDLAIIKLVHQHRAVRSDRIVSAVGGSEQQVGRRLRLLFDAGYLDRPRNQGTYRTDAGHYTYAVGDKGAEVLSERFGIETRSRSWTDKNREVQGRHLKHTLGISDFMLSLELWLKEHPTIELIEREALAGARLGDRPQRNPYSWRVEIQRKHGREPIGINPDQMFGLRFHALPEGAQRAFFFVEIDRGSESLTRSSPRQVSFLEKMVGYAQTRAAWRAEPRRVPFGFSNFRVLTVTTSPERASNMRTKWRELHGDRDLEMFLFLDRKAASTLNLFDSIWINGKGAPASLLPHQYHNLPAPSLAGTLPHRAATQIVHHISD